MVRKTERNDSKDDNATRFDLLYNNGLMTPMQLERKNTKKSIYTSTVLRIHSFTLKKVVNYYMGNA